MGKGGPRDDLPVDVTVSCDQDLVLYQSRILEQMGSVERASLTLLLILF